MKINPVAGWEGKKEKSLSTKNLRHILKRKKPKGKYQECATASHTFFYHPGDGIINQSTFAVRCIDAADVPAWVFAMNRRKKQQPD